ncbi:hypothetical protein [Streptomyces orinoci]|uniref:Uncharacterized protein n=1 Tax=Streptomyces orinoci TaxID=67339 RepID=A0ABV3K060_STRON|nr:hypothetical protein [Streptomyces orinoci]
MAKSLDPAQISVERPSGPAAPRTNYDGPYPQLDDGDWWDPSFGDEDD